MDLTNYRPNILQKWLHVAQMGYAAVHRRYIGRFGQRPRIIVVHIQEGSNTGSWQHFHVVTASCTVLIGQNGDIWQLVPEGDAPWTNGDVMNPTAKGREILNKWGADPNIVSLTIETEGYTGRPIPEAQLKAVVWQIMDWQARYDIDDVYVVRHADINQVTRPRCPGDAYFAQLVEAISGSTTTPTPPVYASPKKLYAQKKLVDGTKDVMLDNGVMFYADQRTVTAAVDGVQPHVYADRKSAFTRKPLKKGDTFRVIGWVTGETVGDDNRWWITAHYSRVDVNGTIEKPDSDHSGGGDPDHPVGTRVVNGIIHYPVSSNGKPYRNLKVAKKANVRAEPNLQSKVLAVVNPNDYIRGGYWCFGEEVKEGKTWWAIAPKDGSDPLGTKRAYLWAEACWSQPSESDDGN